MKDELQQAIRAGEIELVDAEQSLDEKPITLPSGRVLDEAGAEAYGREVADRAAGSRGRPSLTGPGEHSPKISARVPSILKQQITELAARDGRRPAEVVRAALEEYVAAHA